MPKAMHRKGKVAASHEEAAVAEKAEVQVPTVEKAAAAAASKQKHLKKGKTFTTKESMLSILNQVSQVEESRLEKKKSRQDTIKKLVGDKEKRSDDRKKKTSKRLEDMKEQLRHGYSLRVREKKVQKAQKKKGLSRTLSAINREWGAEDDSNAGASAEAGPAAKQKKTVSFAV